MNGILLDYMQGDQMLFARADGVELTLALLTPVIENMEREARRGSFPNYQSGTAGPDQATALLKKDGREWRPL